MAVFFTFTGARKQLVLEQKHKYVYNYMKYEITFAEANCPVLGQNARKRFYELFKS